ncbi:hypothetical protein [Glycomyces sp. NPDC021274]|uniref:hypothetical protein n=1 Tax=Glycomyces sp. NPDC021274 TaxID=3155120 RepID=UPI0033FF6E94
MPPADDRGRGTLRLHVPDLQIQDLDTDSALGIVTMAKAAPAILVDGRPAGAAEDGRIELRLHAGRHRVEIMVRQVYETVAVDIRAGATIDLHLGHHLDRHGGGRDRVHAGTEEHVKQALARSSSPSVVSGVRWGCGLWFPALIVAFVVGLLLREPLGWDAGPVTVGIIGAATAVSLTAGLAAAYGRRRDPLDPAATAPAPLALPDSPALILPAAAAPPAGTGILLRVRPRPRTMHMIGMDKRLRDTIGLRRYEFFGNELTDWVDAPHVHLDGRPLGSAWGTWWIPAPQGPARLYVSVGGIRDPRSAHPAGPAFEAETEVTVPAAGAAEITAWFNFLDMVNERERARPQVASRWQRILRAVDRYRSVAEQAAAEPGLEFTQGTELPR